MTNPNQRYPSRRSLRLRGYDYSQSGVYFVTVCTYQHSWLFGDIIEGEMRPNRLGIVLCEEWQHIEQARNTVRLDAIVVMPNHFHGIIIIDSADSRLDSADDRKRSGTLQAGSLGAIVGQFKAAVSRLAKPLLLARGQRIWQRNYCEQIIRSGKSLNEIRKYIIENPGRWQEDDLYNR